MEGSQARRPRPGNPAERRRRFRLNLTVAVVVPGFLALGWWQLTRALSGNSLSWAYVFEWPLFAGYAVYMWWKLLHQEAPDASLAAPAPGPAEEGPGLAGTGPEDEAADAKADAELAAYNEYLAALNASEQPKQWRGSGRRS